MGVWYGMVWYVRFVLVGWSSKGVKKRRKKKKWEIGLEYNLWREGPWMNWYHLIDTYQIHPWMGSIWRNGQRYNGFGNVMVKTNPIREVKPHKVKIQIHSTNGWIGQGKIGRYINGEKIGNKKDQFNNKGTHILHMIALFGQSMSKTHTLPCIENGKNSTNPKGMNGKVHGM